MRGGATQDEKSWYSYFKRLCESLVGAEVGRSEILSQILSKQSLS